MKLRYVGLILVFFLSLSVASADITGWHYVEDVTEFSIGSTYINESNLGVAQVMILEIYSGEVTDINLQSNTYTVEIDITEPSWDKTTIQINTTNLSGVLVSETHTFYHIKSGPLTSPIYIMVGVPPIELGINNRGVSAKIYREIDLGALISPSGLFVDIPWAFPLNWHTFDDRFLEPPVSFYLTSDGPVDIQYEIQPMEEIYERADRSIGEFALTLISKVPYVGQPLVLSIESISTIMKVFISVVFFAITGWAVLFLLFETLVLAHAIAVMKMTGGGIIGMVGVFSTIAADNYIMIMFVVNLFTKMFTLLIDLVKALRDMSPI